MSVSALRIRSKLPANMREAEAACSEELSRFGSSVECLWAGVLTDTHKQLSNVDVTATMHETWKTI